MRTHYNVYQVFLIEHKCLGMMLAIVVIVVIVVMANHAITDILLSTVEMTLCFLLKADSQLSKDMYTLLMCRRYMFYKIDTHSRSKEHILLVCTSLVCMCIFTCIYWSECTCMCTIHCARLVLSDSTVFLAGESQNESMESVEMDTGNAVSLLGLKQTDTAARNGHHAFSSDEFEEAERKRSRDEVGNGSTASEGWEI